MPGIKPGRGDLILAAAVVIDTVMEAGGFEHPRGDRGRAARGRVLRDAARRTRPPLFDDVRRATVLNLAAQYHPEFAHTEHVAELALEMWDALADGRASRRRPGRARAAVGRGDAARHRHGDRLRRPPQALALPDPQRGPARASPTRGRPSSRRLARYHRKGTPTLGEFAAAGAQGRRGSSRSAVPPCCGSPSSSSARATRRSTPATS